MAEAVLPDVYIDVRAEGLIAPAQITVGRMGIVGTASRGELLTPTILNSKQDARRLFGGYDAFQDGTQGELTLVRALELAYDGGATTVFGVRVTGRDGGGNPTAVPGTRNLASPGGVAATLTAASPGTWAEELTVEVEDATENPFVREELTGPGPLSLSHTPVLASVRNRIRLFRAATGVTSDLEIVTVAPANDDQVQVDLASGALTFGPTALTAGDRVTASYVVDRGTPPNMNARKVTIAYGPATETYTIVDGADLVRQVNAPGGSELVTGENGAQASELPDNAPEAAFTGGENGETDAIYTDGLDALLSADAHIIVAAGQDADAIGADVAAHCANASTDAVKRDRIGVVGSGLGDSLDDILSTADGLGSDRLIFVAPGMVSRDTAAQPPADVTLPGAYAAAAVGGLIASLDPEASPTNKVVGGVRGLEADFGPGELAQLVTNRVLALEERQGIRVVKGITTSTNTAFSQITTRRIVDYAKYGVRSAANPYIGLLNNARVRGALRATVNSFLAQMVLDEMLISYDLDVTATREEERQGIARVTMTLRPTFSIDYIKVTMFLE
jgi:Phage tail sheath C-terminal domain/Phage tail sheath protein subtilisin-like domain